MSCGSRYGESSEGVRTRPATIAICSPASDVGLTAPCPGYTTRVPSKETNPHTEDVGTSPEGVESDVQSDPAEGEQSGDWSGEGGATPQGPATDN